MEWCQTPIKTHENMLNKIMHIINERVTSNKLDIRSNIACLMAYADTSGVIRKRNGERVLSARTKCMYLPLLMNYGHKKELQCLAYQYMRSGTIP